MSFEEEPWVPEEPPPISPKEIPFEPYLETPAEIKSRSSDYGGSDSHKWGNKMEVQRLLSSKPDLEIEEKRTVLFVDDDEVILHSLERELLDELYDKLFAKSGKEALEILKQKKVNVIVTDMIMPEMTGLELLRIARREYPDIIAIVLTGYDLDAELQEAVENREVFRLVAKPLWKLGGRFEKLIRWALDPSNLQTKCNTFGQ
jgi:CheY-like chemotaxis protein